MKCTWINFLFLPLLLFVIPFPSEAGEETPLNLSALIAEALENNPRLAAAKAGWQAMETRIGQADILDDPEVGIDTWNIPNDLDLSETRNWIFFARQRFPAAGTLGLRKQAAETEAAWAEAKIDVTARSIIKAVKVAHGDLYLAHKAIALNEEHIAILKQFEDIAEIKYQTGAVPEQDLLKARVARVQLENERHVLRQRLRIVGSALNTLLKRPPRASLGKPEALQLIELPGDVEGFIMQALNRRPELKAVEAALKHSKQEVALAKQKLKPDYQVSVKRFQNRGIPQPSGWGVSASINLPWLFHEKHDRRIEEKRYRATQHEAMVESLKDETRQAVEDLIVKIQTAEQSAKLYQESVIVQAELSVASAQTGYQTGQVDFLDLLQSQRELITFRLEYFRALTLQNQEAARLEQVVGIDLSDLKNETHGGPK